MRNYILKYFPFYGLAIFFLCNIIAMYFYAGGSFSNPENTGYDFFRNYLSQLGRIRAVNGENNLISFRIWTSGMATTGLIFIIYYITLPTFFETKKIAILGSFLGVISCMCFILTGITPGDIILNLSGQVSKKKSEIGLLVCGSGIGMSITANRHKSIRAALCYDMKSTKLSRKHNNANVMTIGARLIKKNIVSKCVSAFLTTKFSGGRHLRRIRKI